MNECVSCFVFVVINSYFFFKGVIYVYEFNFVMIVVI